jgi:multidrug efflux pump subunit AcrA (membrane-fusion protein)
MLNDPSLMVRGNAALSLVRFGDAAGRAQIVALLQPARITAPRAGKVTDTGRLAAAVHQNGLLMKIESEGQTTEIRSPIAGRIRSLSVTSGQSVSTGQNLAVISPDTEQVWEALRALYLVGQMEDLPVIALYERDLPDIPERVRQQTLLTEQSIRERAK